MLLVVVGQGGGGRENTSYTTDCWMYVRSFHDTNTTGYTSLPVVFWSRTTTDLERPVAEVASCHSRRQSWHRENLVLRPGRHPPPSERPARRAAQSSSGNSPGGHRHHLVAVTVRVMTHCLKKRARIKSAQTNRHNTPTHTHTHTRTHTHTHTHTHTGNYIF